MLYAIDIVADRAALDILTRLLHVLEAHADV